MRSIARQKLGYFPLALAEAERIRRFLMFSGEDTSVLDPCAGTGAALQRWIVERRQKWNGPKGYMFCKRPGLE